MSEYSGRLLPGTPSKSPIARFRPIVFLIAPLLAILFQVYVARFLDALAFLDLPLLVTVYFALMRRSQIQGMFLGAAIGLVQDSLSHQPIGMFGIVKTLVGYFSASMSQRFDVENNAIRFVLGLFFYFFHQFLYWVLVRALLGQPGEFSPQREILLALLNAFVAMPLFRLLDRLRERG
ncbi:MAG: rod shape-determining protein MreD [Bryobacterales bacterium]|nr:rod shape-determining protein MreD [Bryobacterales bacterium]